MGNHRGQVTLPIMNFDFVVGTGVIDDLRTRHGEIFPDNIRAIVVGPSNSRKTNAVFNMLFHPNGLRFSQIYIFSKSLYQPKYKFLEDIVSGLKGIGYYTFSDNKTIPQPEEAKPSSVMVFDDVIREKQNNIMSYFTRGRHRNIDVVYICQKYSKIPKQLNGDNANCIKVFRQDDRNIKHIYHHHVTLDMSLESFKALCDQAWSINPRGFLSIDKEIKPMEGTVVTLMTQ